MSGSTPRFTSASTAGLCWYSFRSMPLWITLHLVGVDGRETAQHVVAGLLRDGDHGVGLRDAVVLDPGAEVVGVAELFHLPGTQRLQRVGGQHERDAPQLLGHEAGELDVPGVAVHDAGIQVILGHRQAAVHGIQRAAEAGIGVLLGLGPGPVALARASSAPDTSCSPKQRTSTGTRRASSRLRYSTCTPAPP